MGSKQVVLLRAVVMLVLTFDCGASVLHRDSRSDHRSRRSVLNSGEILVALEAHNRLRRLEGASNMELMIWDADLANRAEISAETCIWNHTNTGQNMYATNSRYPIKLIAAIEAWYNEKPYYRNYVKTGKCLAPGQQCLHYSQVVWATSRKLGCAYTRCPKLQLSTLTNALLLVCNYDPPGNVVGEMPYQIGTGCSKCATGSWWCNKGLCDQSCTASRPTCACTPVCKNLGSVIRATCSCSCGPGWYGSDCSEVCENKDPRCDPKPGQYGYPPSYCSRRDYGPTAQKICPKMCRQCQANGKSNSNVSTSTRKTLLLTMLAVWLSQRSLENI